MRMKKIVAMTLSLAMILSLAACGSQWRSNGPAKANRQFNQWYDGHILG